MDDRRVEEIGIRLAGKADAEMKGAEKAFFAVYAFTADVLHGGLDEAIAGDGGQLFAVFAEFARRYGDDELRELVGEIAAYFPGGVADDQAARSSAVSQLRRNGDPLGELDQRFRQGEAAIEAGLAALVRNNAAQFAGPGTGAV